MFDSLSVVLPAYNEEKVIGDTLSKVTSYCKNRFREYEVIVVDDSSKDGTMQAAAGFQSDHVRVLHNEVNRGKGFSVKRGVLESKHSLILFMDSDSSLPIENLDRFLPYIEKGSDIVIASRNISGARIKNQQKGRKMLGRAFSLIVGALVISGLSDTQCGFKLFRSGAAKKVFALSTMERFSFDVEVLFIAKKMGYNITEAPVTCVYLEKSSVNPIKDSARMLRDIIHIKIKDFLGAYKTRQ